MTSFSDEHSGSPTGTAKDEAVNVAGTAKDEALNVAGTAKEQARNVVGDAKQQVTSQLSEQATTQRDNLSQTLRTLGDDLQQMAQGQGPAQGMAVDLAQEVSDRVRALGSHLENRDPSQLLDEARDFARRRPGTFLLGALAAGVVAGRLFRATADGAAAASLAETSGTARATQTPGTDVPGAAGTTQVEVASMRYTAPIPSLDAHTGIGYGTGADGTGSLADVPDTDEVPPASTTSTT
ncbi:hypothetical protein GCM10023339_39820 [Alloalcanivorax gelatiniphagus]